MRKISFLFLITYSLFFEKNVLAQEKDLGDKEYIIVKDYKPVLAESFKISDSPDADTTSSTPPALRYDIAPKKIETNFEAGVIKAVKLKDEPITKLYRNLVKLGIGNYSTYYGEVFANSIRSKTGALGLHLKHLSGSPKLSGRGDGSFSDNEANVYGKYFLENSTFSGDVNYNRNVVHYYGYNANDPLLHLVLNDNNTKQRFNNFSMNLGLQSNYMSKGNLDYDVRFRFNSLNDLYDVSEPDFFVSGLVGKLFNEHYFSVLASLDFFKKSSASFERLAVNPLYHNLSRNIVNLEPTVKIENDKIHLALGVKIGLEKNVSSIVHLFPKAEITIPIAVNVLSGFAVVDGNIEKNNFKTITDENPFVTSSVIPYNSIHKLIIKGGLKGNFSNTMSFAVFVKHDQVKDMQLFYAFEDSASPAKFDVLYDNTDVFNVHAELSYLQSEKLNLSLHFDQYSYSSTLQQKAWLKPETVVALNAKYNLRDKIIADFSLFARGAQYARTMQDTLVTATKIKGYLDANFGVEYRYSKILSFYLHLNNLGFTKYYRWSQQYPTEGFNLLGGLTYSF